MAGHGTNGASDTGSRLGRALWLAAGGVLLTGFAMRVLAGIVGGTALRQGGVAVLAIGVTLAAFASLAEWLAHRRASH